MSLFSWGRKDSRPAHGAQAAKPRPPIFEELEARDLMTSDVLPNTLISGPEMPNPPLPIAVDVPPIPMGAVGLNFVVSVANNNIKWQLKNLPNATSTTVAQGIGSAAVEISMSNFFNQSAVQIDGAPVQNAGGQLASLALAQQLIVYNTADLGGPATSTLITFGDYTNPAAIPDDAQVIYDSYFGRYIVMANDTDVGDHSVVYVAVSATENPNDGWYFLSWDTQFEASDQPRDADGNLVDPGQAFLDNMRLGMTSDALVITGNVLFVPPDDGDDTIEFTPPIDSRILTITKQRLYEGGAAAGFGMIPIFDPVGRPGDFQIVPQFFGEAPINMVPSVNYGQDFDTNFILATLQTTSNIFGPEPFQGFAFFRLTNASNTQLFIDEPVVISGAVLSPGYMVNTPGFNIAIARGGNNGLVSVNLDFNGAITSSYTDAGSYDIEDYNFLPNVGAVVPTNVVWRADPDDPGNGWLVTANTLNRPGISSDFPEVRWYEFRAKTEQALPPGQFNFNGVTFVQQGTVNTTDIDQTTNPLPVQTYSPGVGIDQFGDIAIAFSASNANLFIGPYYTGRFRADLTLGNYLGTTRRSRALVDQDTLAFYNRQAFGGPVYWGPSASAVPDLFDLGRWWTFNAYTETRPPQQNDFGFWATTWGAFALVPDSKVFVIDVSHSMFEVRNQDINGDGVVDASDDLNKDGKWGTTLDLAISLVLSQFDLGIMPGQGDNPGTVSLIIFGADARPVQVNLTATGSGAFRVNPTIQTNGFTTTDFLTALFSIKEGSAGIRTETTVDPNSTNYSSIFAAAGLLQIPPVVTAIEIFSDGSGRFNPATAAPLVASRVTVAAVGPYQRVGYLDEYYNIATATDGVFLALGVPAAANLRLDRPAASISGRYDGGYVPSTGLPLPTKYLPSTVQGLPGVPDELFAGRPTTTTSTLPTVISTTTTTTTTTTNSQTNQTETQPERRRRVGSTPTQTNSTTSWFDRLIG